jgi:hypothetical protein
MDVSEVRAATLEALKSSDENDVSYIDEELLEQYESESRDAAESPDDAAHAPPEDDAGDEAETRHLASVESAQAYVYGNHPLWVPRNDRPPNTGVFYWSNGSPGYPNDPCGRANRWHRWLRYTPSGTQFRTCRGYVSFRFLIV